MENIKSIKETVMEDMKWLETQYLDDDEMKTIISGIAIGVESTLKSLVGNRNQDLILEIIKELEQKYVKDPVAHLLEKELEM